MRISAVAMRVGLHFAVLFAAAAAAKVSGQTVIDLEEHPKFNETFEQIQGERLHCYTHHRDPEVDFGFRFEIRYHVECEIRQFEGKSGVLKVYLRVRPENGVEMALGDAFAIPKAPSAFDLSKLNRVHAMLGFSGALSAGVGTYDVELLMIDNRQHIYRDHWKAKAYPKGHERELAFTMEPNTLAPLTAAPIPPKSGPDDRPLTVLLNAAPLNPWSLKLRAWDRAFLLDSLSSLLRHIPYSSVRVVAFNLEQQEEIFRRDHFGENDIPDLADALRDLELGTITYDKLVRHEGWAELLLDLLKKEAHAERKSQAVVLLGPNLRLNEKVPTELLVGSPLTEQSLYCVTYYPWIGSDFPDSVQYLTSALKGKVFRIHSPAELGQNLEKLTKELDGDASARTMRAHQ